MGILVGLISGGIGIAIFCLLAKAKGNQTPVSAVPEVDKDFVREAVQFFTNYLSLCQKHDVSALTWLVEKKRDELGVEVEISCTLHRIDGEYATSKLSVIPWWHKEKLAALNVSYEAFKKEEEAFANYMKEYLGSNDLHYAFADTDEYKFLDNGDVIVGFERVFFKRKGKWQPTMNAIRDELLRKFPNAKIEIKNFGLTVDK